MDILALKELIENELGIYVSKQQLLFHGHQLENDRSIGDYFMQNGDTIHLILDLRGGMYHFTSGRSDFRYLPCDTINAVKHVLAFNDEDIGHAYPLSSVRLQEFLLQRRTLLLSLYRSIENVDICDSIPNLRNILSTTNDDEDCEDDDMSTSDE